MFKKTPRFIFAFVLGLIIFLPSFFILPKLSYATTTYHTLTVYRVTYKGNLNGGGFITSSNNGIDSAINCQTTSTGCSVQVADGTSFGLTLVPDAGSTGSFLIGGLDACYGFQLADTICDVELMSTNLSLTYGFKKNASLAPTITSIFPSVGIVGSTVTIDGANFSGIDGVLFGSIDVGANNFKAVSSTRITAVVPPGATDGKITVRTTSENIVSADTFVVAQAGNLAPQIISFTPITGNAGSSGISGSLVMINGYNLTGASRILFNGISAIPVTSSVSTVTVYVPTGATNGPISVVTSNGVAISDMSFTIIGTTIPTTEGSTGGSGVGAGGTTSNTNIKFNGLVPVCNTIIDNKGGFSDPCDFNMLMALINKIINFLLITLATPLFALILIYVGWLYLSSGGSSENVTKAKKILKNAFIGYVIALAAWLIVKTILTTLGFTGPMFLG